MAQNFPRFCPRCGAATDSNQRFCVKCGLDLAPRLPHQGSQPSPQPGYQPSQPGFHLPSKPISQPGFQQMPRPSEEPVSRPPLRPTSEPGFQPVSQPGYQQPWEPPPQSQQHFPQSSPVPSGYAAPSSAPIQATRGPEMGRLGLVLVLLLVLAVLGGAIFIGLRYLGLGGNATQMSTTTTSINSTVTYAGIIMTVLKVEQAQNFIDDPNSTDNGMLRIHFQAQNKTTVPVNLMYNSIARLIAPGGKTLTPTFVKANIGVAPGATQTGIMDFAVPANAKVNQYRLRLGAPNEAQMDIPLARGANLDQYAPKTTNLNGSFQYLGLNWSLVSATSQLSIDGKQASKGMRYMSVTLKVNNTLSQKAIPGSAYDYMRMKAGSTTATPRNTTLPVSFDAGVTGKTGTVTFLVPQNINTFTLTLLAQPQSGFDQATQDFRLS